MSRTILTLRPRASATTRCAVCHDDRDVATLRLCPSCRTPSHADCARLCPILGCGAVVGAPAAPSVPSVATTSRGTAPWSFHPVRGVRSSSPTRFGLGDWISVAIAPTCRRLGTLLILTAGIPSAFVPRHAHGFPPQLMAAAALYALGMCLVLIGRTFE